jgi:chromosome segregation ATPase
MGKEQEDISKSGWSEYGRLVLKELERLNAGQESLKKDLDDKLQDINTKITEIKNTEKDVDDLKKWKDEVSEVWSVTQMKEAKDEIYDQKNKWTKVFGAIIAINILFMLFMAFKDHIM